MSAKRPLITALEGYLTEKRTIMRHLAGVLIFGFIIISSYTPEVHLDGWDEHGYNNILYTWLLFLTGLVVLSVCKGLMVILKGKRRIPIGLLAVILVAEFVAMTATISWLAWTIHTDQDLTVSMAVGFTVKYQFLILLVPHMALFPWHLYEERKVEVARLRDILSFQQDPHPEQSDVSINFCDKSGKLSFATKRSNVLYVEAADNYTNIHYLSGEREESFILHNSLKNVDEAFSSYCLLRCHRGYLVNVDNVKLLRREKDGMVLEMAHCDKLIPVSKTYAESIIKHFAI